MTTTHHHHHHDHDHDHHHHHDDDHHGHHHDHEHPTDLAEILRIAFVGLAILAVWFRLWEPFEQISVIGLAATLVGGYPIFKHALMDITQRRMTMELSMTIALVSALLIGEFVTVLVIVFFVLIAEVLEGLTVGRGRRAIKQLLDLLPDKVHVRREGSVGEIASSELQVGDVVVVRPGARVPVDGKVVSGHSFVDQATITGESMPAEKVTGTEVYAGTINQSGVLEVQTTGLGSDTAYGKIIQAVEQAEKSRAPIQKTADQLAGYLVYFALACAVFTFLITRDVRSTISVIIVAGACGIAAGTPLAILGAIGRSARLGAIIKGGIHLEVLWRVLGVDVPCRDGAVEVSGCGQTQPQRSVVIARLRVGIDRAFGILERLVLPLEFSQAVGQNRVGIHHLARRIHLHQFGRQGVGFIETTLLDQAVKELVITGFQVFTGMLIGRFDLRRFLEIGDGFFDPAERLEALAGVLVGVVAVAVQLECCGQWLQGFLVVLLVPEDDPQ